MTPLKTTRRILAGISAVVVVLCQSAALAHACAGSAAQPAPAAAHAPCHDAGENNLPGPAHDAHPAQCLSQATASSPALPDVPLLAGLPALVIRAAVVRITEAGLTVSALPPVQGEPPPLAILHCCLRN
jgi:hypothetical protein